MNSTKKPILHYVNTVKTIGIFCIIFSHLTVPYPISAFISSYRMPLFFFISGYLFSTRSYEIKEFIERKGRTLLFPFYFFAAITFLFWLISESFLSDEVGLHLKKYLLGFIYIPASKEYLGFNIPIWFFPSLFISEIIFFFLLRYAKDKVLIISSALFILGIFVIKVLPFRLPWGSDVSLFAVLFICLGYIARKKSLIEDYIVNKSTGFRVALMVITLSVAIISAYFNSGESKVSVYTLHFNNYLLFMITGISAITFLFTLGISLPQHRFFDFYGRNTIVITGLHLMTYALLKGVQVFIFKIPLDVLESNFLYNFMYAVMAIIALGPVITFINKYIPFVLGRKKAILK